MGNDVTHETLKLEMDLLTKKVETLTEKQDEMIKELSRYKGFFGGIMLAASALSVCITLVLTYLKVK